MSIQTTAIQKAKNGERLSFTEALYLYENVDLIDLAIWARQAKIRQSGQKVYYNINRHINLSNICTASCPLCAFSCEEGDKRGFMLTKEDVIAKIKNTIATVPNLTEIHIVSSLHPHNDFNYYIEILKTIKELLPNVHIQAFTPVEIVHFANISGKTIDEVLSILKEAGLDSLPGGGAEILDDEVRKIICPNKATSEQWIYTIKAAHKMGMKTNASELYGHVETIEQRLKHLFTLRDIQDETGGFQAFISFPFHPANTAFPDIKPITSYESLKFIAISRLVLDNIPHIKAFWMMLTLPIAQFALACGADDLDGTVEEEKIIHAAGAHTGQKMTTTQLEHIIRTAGYIPVQRDSLYNEIKND